MDRVFIVGTGLNSKYAYNFIKRYALYEVAGFAVNKEFLLSSEYLGLPVYAIEELDEVVDKNRDYLFVAIFWNHLNADRKKVFEEIKSRGYRMVNLISPNAIMNGRILGENCWIDDYAIIDDDVEIYDDVFIRPAAAIGHASKIYSHSFIAFRSVLAGAVSIGEQSFVGINATILDETNIGKKCIVGAGTIVKRNLSSYHAIKTAADSCMIKGYTEDLVEQKLVASKNVR